MSSVYIHLQTALQLNPAIVFDRLLRGELEDVTSVHLVELLSEASTDFSESVDKTALEWLETNWGRVDDKNPVTFIKSWRRFFDLLYHSQKLSLTGMQLDRFFDQSLIYFRFLCGDEKINPLGAYLLAVGSYQIDDSLKEQWWDLASLNPKVTNPVNCLVIRQGFWLMPWSGKATSKSKFERLCSIMIRLTESLHRLERAGITSPELSAFLTKQLTFTFSV